MKKKGEQKWTPDNLPMTPMTMFLPFDFFYSNITFYFSCTTGSFLHWETVFFTVILNWYYIGIFFKIFRALFYLIFSAPLTAKETAGEQVVSYYTSHIELHSTLSEFFKAVSIYIIGSLLIFCF